MPNLANQELSNRLEKMFAGSGASIVTVARKFFDDVFGGATLERLGLIMLAYVYLDHTTMARVGMNC